MGEWKGEIEMRTGSEGGKKERKLKMRGRNGNQKKGHTKKVSENKDER